MFNMHTKIKNNVKHGLGCMVISLITRCNVSYAADCTLKLLPTSPVTWVGEFTNIQYSDDHEWGETMELWRSDNCFFGFFTLAGGLHGDARSQLIKNVVFNSKTHNISFEINDDSDKNFINIVKGVLNKNTFNGMFQTKNKVKKSTTLGRSFKLKRDYYSSYEPKRHEDDPYETVTTYKNYGEWLLDFKQYKKYR